MGTTWGQGCGGRKVRSLHPVFIEHLLEVTQHKVVVAEMMNNLATGPVGESNPTQKLGPWKILSEPVYSTTTPHFMSVQSTLALSACSHTHTPCSLTGFSQISASVS